MLPRPCLVVGCPGMSVPNRSRCRPHLSQVSLAKRRRRAEAPGDGAAARTRRNLTRAGFGYCQVCAVGFPSTELEVDHVLPLADGGTDYVGNIQVLCHPCHVDKTSTEARARRSTP